MKRRAGLPAALAFAGAALVSAQGPQASGSPLASDTPSFRRPDVMIVVQQDSTGADLVEITALAPDYPGELLSRQATQIGDLAGISSRGLSVYRFPTAVNGRHATVDFTKCRFATNGLLEPDGGVRLQALVAPFVGNTGAGKVEAMTVFFTGVKAAPNLLRAFESPAVRVEGKADANPPMIEYQVTLLSQDPGALAIPDRPVAPAAAAPARKRSPISPAVFWSLVGLGGAAAGALVYNLALRGAPRTGAKSGRVHR